jgi:hypothetical protein
VSDATRRATRTLLQGLPGAFLVTGWNLFSPPHVHLNAEQAAWMITLVTALTSFLQNSIEAATDQAILKTPMEKAIARGETGR